MTSLNDWIAELRATVHARPRGWATREDLAQVDGALAAHPASVDLWLLRGDLIQLSEECEDMPPLVEALRSYQNAAQLAPERPEPHMAIGHYLDAVDDDPRGAIPWFQKAVELGGGDVARAALAAAKAQLEG